MRIALFFAAVLFVAGCSSLQNAGVSEYSMKPFQIDGAWICCEVNIKSGREIGNVTAHVKKNGDSFEIDLTVGGVKAFEGQAISSATAGAVVPGLTNNVTEWLKK